MSEPGRKFTIGPCLGRGGFGEVYRATMRSPGGLETQVAVKVLRAELDAAGEAVARLRDEGRLLAMLDHPVILRVHDLVLLDGRVALVTEYVDGADLDACAKPPDPIGARAALQAISAVAGALDAAGRAASPDGAPLGLVHRDLKPSNIRVGRHGDPKLLDFGVARSEMADREARTDSDLVVGSLAYMAPERFVDREAGAPSDVFGLGCVLYELLVGERFHPRAAMRDVSAASTDPDTYAEHLAERLARLAGEPEPLGGLVASLLAWEPADRPTAGQLAQRGDQLADELPGPTLGAWCRAHPWPAAPRLPGALEGRVLTEGALPLDRVPAAPIRLVRQAVLTLDADLATRRLPPAPAPIRTADDIGPPARVGPVRAEPVPDAAPSRSGALRLLLLAAALVVAFTAAGVVFAGLGALGIALWAM